jgi:hypothetical protein
MNPCSSEKFEEFVALVVRVMAGMFNARIGHDSMTSPVLVLFYPDPCPLMILAYSSRGIAAAVIGVR